MVRDFGWVFLHDMGSRFVGVRLRLASCIFVERLFWFKVLWERIGGLALYC